MSATRPERPRYNPKDSLVNLQRIPPQALEAEWAVLAGILVFPDGIAIVRGLLRAEQFYRRANQVIFEGACAVEDSGVGVDRVTVAQWLEEQGLTDLCEGPAYLLSLAQKAPLKSRLPKYASLIRDAAALRDLIDRCGRITGDAYDREQPAAKILEDAAELLAQARSQSFGPAQLATFTARELAARDVPETEWILPGLLRDGLTVLGGKSKIGKSWLVYEFGLWLTAGWDPVNRVRMPPREALYLALEDDDRRLKSRLLQLLNGSAVPEGLHLGVSCPTLDRGAAARICSFLDEHPGVRLVVIDTLARVRGVPDPRGNAYYQDYDVLARLQQVALSRRIALVLVHHLKKGEDDDPFDSLSGSTGMQGPCDGMIVLRRVRSETVGRLEVTGRGIPDRRLDVEWSDQVGWIIRGDSGTRERTQAELDVLAALIEHGSSMTPAGLAPVLKRRREVIGKHLQRMEARGLLVSNSGWYWPTAAGMGAWDASDENAASPGNAASAASAESEAAYGAAGAEAELAAEAQEAGSEYGGRLSNGSVADTAGGSGGVARDGGADRSVDGVHGAV